MRLQELKERLVEAMTETVRFGRGESIMYGSTNIDTNDGNICVEMYNNCNRVYIEHHDGENRHKCANLAVYLEDILPTWYDIRDRITAFPSNQIYESYN